MQDSLEQKGFSFVNYDGPKLPRDRSVRRLIRQRAMKDAGEARRQKGDYGQHNLRQPPIFLERGNGISHRSKSTENPPSKASSPSQEVVLSPGVHHTRPKRSSRPSSDLDGQSGITRVPDASSNFTVFPDFDLLLNFIPLTGLRLGIATISHLIPDVVRTRNLFSTPQPGSRKLLSFIPSRYGQVSSLRHATDCVLAKLRQMMQPTKVTGDVNATVLVHYSKALRALQDALDDEFQRMTPETLCATEMLGVFEVLNGKSEDSWIRHVDGASRLIEVRGPHRFESEFEQALFIAHIGPTVMDAFLKNTTCFLAEEQWQNVICSAVHNDESLADEKDLILSLWRSLIRGPQLFKDTTDILLYTTSPSQAVVDDLIERVLESRKNLMWWLSQAQQNIAWQTGELEECIYGLSMPTPILENRNLSSRYITQLALRGTYAVCRIIKARLVFALAPSRFHHLELECQDLARRIVDLRQTATVDKTGSLVWSMFMTQSAWIAKGTLETEGIWNEGWEGRDGMIERWKFEAWCKAIGRKLPSAECGI